MFKETWWTMRLGLASFFVQLLGVFNGFIRRVFDSISANKGNVGIPLGFAGVVFALIFSISVLFISIRAYRQGERTWVLWTGFISALLVAQFWVIMIVGEFIFPH